MTEPTGRAKFFYYTLGLTPPAVSSEWVERDIHTTGWQVRRFLQVWIGMAIGFVLVGPLRDQLVPEPEPGRRVGHRC